MKLSNMEEENFHIFLNELKKSSMQCKFVQRINKKNSEMFKTGI